jgi:hypothetical protein
MPDNAMPILGQSTLTVWECPACGFRALERPWAGQYHYLPPHYTPRLYCQRTNLVPIEYEAVDD